MRIRFRSCWVSQIRILYPQKNFSTFLISLLQDDGGFKSMLEEMQRKEAAVQAYQAQFTGSTVRILSTRHSSRAVRYIYLVPGTVHGQYGTYTYSTRHSSRAVRYVYLVPGTVHGQYGTYT